MSNFIIILVLPFFHCIFIGVYLHKKMEFVGMWVKVRPFPHFHEPKSHLFSVIIQHSFFIVFLTLSKLMITAIGIVPLLAVIAPAVAGFQFVV